LAVLGPVTPLDGPLATIARRSSIWWRRTTILPTPATWYWPPAAFI